MPTMPVALQIRKIVFENYNDVDRPFTNDEIFEILKREGADPSWIIDDLEPYIREVCDLGMARSIGQNFTTIWLKLFDTVVKHHCAACGFDVFLGRQEEMLCPNPACKERL